MCIHPDDPPRSILGLPRVVSTEADFDYLVQEVPNKANGITFCTGSLGVHPDNDLSKIFKKYGNKYRYNGAHFVNTTKGNIRFKYRGVGKIQFRNRDFQTLKVNLFFRGALSQTSL